MIFLEEIWKAIVNYEGLYEVSNLGRVRSLNYKRTGKIKVLRPRPSKLGYLDIRLSKNGKVKPFKVHRLVAYAFIPNDNPIEKTQVNHKDFNRQNNSVENLEWVSHKENIKHSWTSDEKRAKERREKLSKAHEVTRTRVLCIETERVFDSIREACEWLDIDYDISHGNICACLKGRLKTAYGYHWEYVKELD